MSAKTKKILYKSLSEQAVPETDNIATVELKPAISKIKAPKLKIETIGTESEDEVSTQQIKIIPDSKIEKSAQTTDNSNKISSWCLKIKNWLDSNNGVPLTQKIFLVQNLSIMLKAGLSLGAALNALKEQTPNKRLKNVLALISERVDKGESFANALKFFPKIFNELFVNMVESGELSGNLEEVLKQLHIQLKRDHELISKVRGAMIYPSVVIIAMLGIGTFVIIFVMPKFVSIFAEFQATLPLPTRILIHLSDLVQTRGLLVALVFITTLIVLIKFFKTTKGHRLLHHFFLVAPILGPIVKKINLARFSRTISSLIKTDIPIVQSFNITSRTLGNIFYREAMLESAEKIKKGSSINLILREYPTLFPPVVTQMITVGEESGSVDTILEELAEFYEEEVDQTMKNLPSIIEPVLMLVLGIGVAGMAVAVLMPMYSLSDAI